MTKIPSVEVAVEVIRQRYINLKANNPVGFVHLFADIKKALTAEREAGAREAVVEMTRFAAISRYDGERYYSVSESTIKALTPPTK
jgi:hypothetical protein